MFLLFSGFLMPLAILPEWLQQLAEALPFQYLIYFPVMIFIGKVDASAFVNGLIMQLVWILAFAAAIHLFWRAGLRRYTAYGG